MAWLSPCNEEVASQHGDSGPIIIKKARAQIACTECWAQHACFTQIIHLTMTGLGQAAQVICPGSCKGSQRNWGPTSDVASHLYCDSHTC